MIIAAILFAGQRNIFEFVEKARPVQKTVKAVKAVVAEPRVVTTAQAPITPTKPDPPRFPYRCLGRFGPDADPFAVFEAGGAIINVRRGQTIDDKFVLKTIGIESITIEIEGQEQRIPIG